jgi:hypothetical protein
MPKLEELQFVHWGSLRPDPIPLLTDGINVATGPNGSGKSCFLDGVKLLLGVTDFAAGRTPGKYVFDGGPTGIGAERAWLRATFANPIAAGRRHRVFAVAGGGCENAEHVSVVCLVTGENRRYRVVPGRIVWGIGNSLDTDLRKFEAAHPINRWLGPRQFDDLLDRAGVTKALRGVLSLPQGATDRLVEERPTGLLRRLLELTGKQITLEEFRKQREHYKQALDVYVLALEGLRSEERQLAYLDERARRYQDWIDVRTNLASVEEIQLPAARHRDLQVRIDRERNEAEAHAKSITTSAERLNDLNRRLPVLRAKAERAEDNAAALREERKGVRSELSNLDQRIGVLRQQAEQLERSFESAQTLANGRTVEQAQVELDEAKAALVAATHQCEVTTALLEEAEQQVATLLAGKPVLPSGMEVFLDALRKRGISALLAAEALGPRQDDADSRVLAEAALGDALWAVVVPPDRYSDACALAIETGHRWPIVRAGQGKPIGCYRRWMGGQNSGACLHCLMLGQHQTGQTHSTTPRPGATPSHPTVRGMVPSFPVYRLLNNRCLDPEPAKPGWQRFARRSSSSATRLRRSNESCPVWIRQCDVQ